MRSIKIEDEVSSIGRVTIRAEELTVVSADWGGWHWRAEGGDRLTTERRLTDRLMRLNPFDGFEH